MLHQLIAFLGRACPRTGADHRLRMLLDEFPDVAVQSGMPVQETNARSANGPPPPPESPPDVLVLPV